MSDTGSKRARPSVGASQPAGSAQGAGPSEQKCFACGKAPADDRRFCRILRGAKRIALCSPSCALRYFDTLFTTDKPVVSPFHGYAWLIHRLTCRRTNHKNLHVRGYKEKGTTTTPSDVCVFNDIDRCHLVRDAIDRVPHPGSRAAYVRQAIDPTLIAHRPYIDEHGEDLPDVGGWKWGRKSTVSTKGSLTEADNA